MTSVYENLEKNKNTAGTAVIEEIDHFATLATEWWDPDGEFRSLHKINPIRIKYIRDQICHHFGRSTKDIKPLSGLSILDVGCGGGLICEPLTRLGANVTGIDAVERSIKIAKNHSRSMSLAGAHVNVLCCRFVPPFALLGVGERVLGKGGVAGDCCR